MPALQVRDFPDDLYEQLKASAASQHRSIAQQTIVAVEQMLEAADAQHYWDRHDLHRLERRPRCFDFDIRGAKRAASRSARSCSRRSTSCRNLTFRMIFHTVELIRQGREERDAIIDAMIAAEKQKAVEA